MKRRTQAQWQALIKEQAQSGLTATEFCKERGINGKYFSDRKQRLLKATPESSGFIAARVQPSANRIEVKVAQTTIHLPAAQPAQWLADFVKALQ